MPGRSKRLALAHASVGEKDQSLAFLEQAERERSAMFTMSVIGPGYLLLAPTWMKEWFDACRERAGLVRLAPAVASTTSDQKRV